MEKGFLKLTTDSKGTTKLILIVGFIVTVLLGIKAYKETELVNGNELYRNDAAEGDYEQKLIARVGEQKIPVTVTVEERMLSEKEAEEEFLKAEHLLPNIIKGENESLSKVSAGLMFATQIPDTCVEVEWTEKQLDYFYSDGRLREDLTLKEPVELQISAILICQEYTRDYVTTITVLPTQPGIEQKLSSLIQQKNENKRKKDVLVLPEEYQGEALRWRKPMDSTFLYFGAFTISSAIFLKLGEKRDQKEALKERQKALEKDYAQIVSKFAMLLSAGLSVRNAWERIVLMQRRKGTSEKVIEQELHWALLQMQKGVPELEVYEKFGARVKEIHYKKLMALFISDKRRGSIPLLDAMNQEMMLAWEEQKRNTRQQGEKIGTKLLLPMMGMLGVVFIMILVPAFLSFQ